MNERPGLLATFHSIVGYTGKRGRRALSGGLTRSAFGGRGDLRSDAIFSSKVWNTPTTTFGIDTLPFSWYLFLHTHNNTRRQRMFPACRTAGEPFAIPQFALTRSDIETFMDERRGFHAAFRACFARQEPRDQVFNYMVGQFSMLERKSIAPMALQVEGGKGRAMQRLVSEALWDEGAMRETYHRLIQDEMGEPAGVLIVDETGFVKKGQDSVGVARQYCGALGQVEHCQGGVFAA